MTTAERLRQAQERLARLSPRRLQVAEDFLAYLEEKEASEATEELLSLPGFLTELEAAEREMEEERLTSVDDLARKT